MPLGPEGRAQTASAAATWRRRPLSHSSVRSEHDGEQLGMSAIVAANFEQAGAGWDASRSIDRQDEARSVPSSFDVGLWPGTDVYDTHNLERKAAQRAEGERKTRSMGRMASRLRNNVHLMFNSLFWKKALRHGA